MNELIKTEQRTLDEKTDEFLQNLIEKNIPPSIINSIVYSLFRTRELNKALSFARIQTLLNPSDPNDGIPTAKRIIF